MTVPDINYERDRINGIPIESYVSDREIEFLVEEETCRFVFSHGYDSGYYLLDSGTLEPVGVEFEIGNDLYWQVFETWDALVNECKRTHN